MYPLFKLDLGDLKKILFIMYKNEIQTEVSPLPTVFFVISCAPKFYLSPQSNAIRMRVGRDVIEIVRHEVQRSRTIDSSWFLND